MVVLLVDLKVLVEVVDALGQKCDLHFGRTRVPLAPRILRDDLVLSICVYPPME